MRWKIAATTSARKWSDGPEKCGLALPALPLGNFRRLRDHQMERSPKSAASRFPDKLRDHKMERSPKSAASRFPDKLRDHK
jgi:hypothetical protein